MYFYITSYCADLIVITGTILRHRHTEDLYMYRGSVSYILIVNSNGRPNVDS